MKEFSRKRLLEAEEFVVEEAETKKKELEVDELELGRNEELGEFDEEEEDHGDGDGDGECR